MGKMPGKQMSALRTTGDFPHVRRRSVSLSCCTTTTCCATLLVGAGGAFAGAVYGLVQGFQATTEASNIALAIPILLGKFVLSAAGWCLAGLLAGAAVGFVIDMCLGVVRL